MWAVEERASSEMIVRIGCWKPEGRPENEASKRVAQKLKTPRCSTH
ncbi:hypothetical protein WKK05_40895 (plasmid) [Nostoc sp. UHCC 0302]